jgi:hypothetical protein
MRMRDVPAPKRPRRRKWVDRIEQAAVDDRPAVFRLSELPRSGIDTLRASAHYLGYQVAIRTDQDRGEALVYVLGVRDQPSEGGGK